MSFHKSGTAYLVPILALALGLTGCGVIIGGTSDTVSLGSSPSGADVEIGPLGQRLTTPTQVSLKRKNDYLVTFSKEGYESEQVRIDHNIRGAILAGDILTGLIPVIVDAATGAWFELEPERVNVTLTPAGDAGAEEAGTGDGTAAREIHVQLRTDGGRLRAASTEPVSVTIRRL